MSDKDRRIRTLIVDDAPLMRKVISRALQTTALFDVVATVTNGSEAVESAQRLKPELVIMDLDMPELNGISATHAIKNAPHPPRVVILTLHADEEHRRASLAAGADAFCDKLDFHDAFLPAVLRLFET